MNLPDALEFLQEHAPDLPEEALLKLLQRHSVIHAVDGNPQRFFDPYAAALDHMMHPRTVQSRTEGDVSEVYARLEVVAAHLRESSARLRASWPAENGVKDFSCEIEVGGFN